MTNESDLKLVLSYVDNLFSFKKKYGDVCETIVAAEKALKYVDTPIKENANYWLSMGRIYSCSATHSQKAIEAFKKATQLDPGLLAAWNELGEAYWANLEVEKAKQSFERALEISENKVSLRSLSVVARKLSEKMNLSDKIEAHKSALLLAKRSLDLDPTDGKSWSILGNSYLAVFFDSPPNNQYINQAIACYTQAEKNSNDYDLVEIYFNKGMALKYIEKYQLALEYFMKSMELEESWDPALKTYNSLIHYLDSIRKLIGKKGNLKPERYKKFLYDLEYKFKHGSSSNGKKSNFHNPPNVSYHLGKVLWTLEDLDDTFPVTIGLLDNQKMEKVVTIFNLSAPRKFLKVGDHVVILNPQLKEVDFTHKEKNYKFSKIRVDDPSSLLINNKTSVLFYSRQNIETSPK